MNNRFYSREVFDREVRGFISEVRANLRAPRARARATAHCPPPPVRALCARVLRCITN